jgi:hypothetical protein
LRTTIPPEFDRALAQLVDLTGVAKATFVRHALGELLTGMGLVYPEVAASLVPKKSTGRVSAATMTRKRATHGN